MRLPPETARRADYPRLVREAFEALDRRISALEARYSAFGDFADDTAAAAGGVAVGGFYHTSGAVRVRVS